MYNLLDVFYVGLPIVVILSCFTSPVSFIAVVLLEGKKRKNNLKHGLCLNRDINDAWLEEFFSLLLCRPTVTLEETLSGLVIKIISNFSSRA